jgi:hypothetical protein
MLFTLYGTFPFPVTSTLPLLIIYSKRVIIDTRPEVSSHLGIT